jgi:hypothetical protein
MEEKEIKNQSENQNSLKKNSPLVFISHDTRDAEIAEAFSRLIQRVSAGILKSFRSSDNKGNQGIGYGDDWYKTILEKLQESTDVVCILSELSMNRPWILFEAGIAKGKLDTKILGVAFGIPLNSVQTGPFYHFQNCNGDIVDLTKLVKQLLKKLPDSEPDEDVIKQQVELFKKTTDEIIKKRQETTTVQEDIKQEDNNKIAKLFEEIKLMFQDLKSKIEIITNKTNDYEKIEEIEKQIPNLNKLADIADSQTSIRNLSKPMRSELIAIKKRTPDLESRCNECLSKIHFLIDKTEE